MELYMQFPLAQDLKIKSILQQHTNSKSNKILNWVLHWFPLFQFLSWSNFIFRGTGPETYHFHYHFADLMTWKNSPDCLYNKKLSCLRLNDTLKVEVHINMYFPYHILKYFEKIIASDKMHWNVCPVPHLTLKLHKLTGWFIFIHCTS